ncbi:MAG: hypothetical protein RLZZ381_1125, partial [Cyanobacteriota bacterium]
MMTNQTKTKQVVINSPLDMHLHFREGAM